jgi:hypothetical protein
LWDELAYHQPGYEKKGYTHQEEDNGTHFQYFRIKAIIGRLKIMFKGSATITTPAKCRTLQVLDLGIIGVSENIARRMANSAIAATVSNLVSCFMFGYFFNNDAKSLSTNHIPTPCTTRFMIDNIAFRSTVSMAKI